MRLTLKEKLFVRYYLGSEKGNATRAALRAGFGTTSNSCGVAGHHLLRNPKIRAAIDANLNEVAMSEEEVLIRLSDRAASDAGDFIAFDADASPNRPPSLDLRRAKRRGKLGSIRKIKVNQAAPDLPAVITEVEIHDPLPALALLLKYHGIADASDLKKLSDDELRAKLDGADAGGGAAGPEPPAGGG